MPLESKEAAEYEYEVIREEWEKISPFLAPRNDQVMGKSKSTRTKRKFSLEESEALGAEGPSNSRSKRDKVHSEPLIKPWEMAELAKQPTENMDLKLPSPGTSEEEEKAPVYCGPLQPEKALSLGHRDQKAPSLAQSWTSLEMLKKTLVDIMKLKVKVQEKQTAVLSMKQKSRKSARKEIMVMEKELQELQEQLCTEQEQHQQRVEQLEKMFCGEQEQEVQQELFVLCLYDAKHRSGQPVVYMS